MCTWGWGGVGWGNTVHVNLNRHGLYDVHLGLGWGGVGQHRSCQLEQAWTVWCGMTRVFVQVDLNVMLPSPIFSCTCTHTRHATLCDLPLHLHMHEMLRSAIFSCACTHTHTHVMLRSGIFSSTCTRASCYALLSSLALGRTCHATLWELLLHLRTHMTDRLSSMSHFLFPIKGSGYSSFRPFSAKKWNCYDEFCSNELPKTDSVAYILKKNSHSPKRHGLTKNCRYVELIRLHILFYCMELRWRQPCSDSLAPCC